MFTNCTKEDIKDLKKFIKDYIVDNMRCDVRKEHGYYQEFPSHYVTISVEDKVVFEFEIEG